MILTDAMNEVFGDVSDMQIVVEYNKVTIGDEYGRMFRFFTDHDPDLVRKLREFYGILLKRRTDKLQERCKCANKTKVWYEVRLDNHIFPRDTEDEAFSLAKKKGEGATVLRVTAETLVRPRE